MLITRTSIITGVERTMDLPVTQEQLDAWEAGGLVQNVFPHLADDEREFILSGITAEEWAEMPTEEELLWLEDDWDDYYDDEAF